MDKFPFAWTFLEEEGVPKTLNCLWKMQTSDDASTEDNNPKLIHFHWT